MQRRYLRNFNLRLLPQARTQHLIIGGGAAGLWAALKLAAKGGEVMLALKGERGDSNSFHAQGGIAAAVGEDDSPALHLQDTLLAGGGLCDLAAVGLFTREGARAVRELAASGVDFDCVDGIWQCGREGGHSRRRVLHVDGDATGAGIVRSLWRKAAVHPRIKLLTGYMALDLLCENGRCRGALLQSPGGLVAVNSGSTILATGGAGQLYLHTSNPEGATGDGVAMAYRAGVKLSDLEFFQFHPTVLALNGAPSFLISEAVRGEGALLVNSNGERFMPKIHPLAELAPRDVVARELHRQRCELKQKVFLDATRLSCGWERFPAIYQTCRALGLDPGREPLPVAPAAHYWMGGIKVDLFGRTSMAGLYACGEVACSGLHGANRLASNSLLEAVVLGGRVAKAAAAAKSGPGKKLDFSWEINQSVLPDHRAIRRQIAACMEENVGVARDESSLSTAVRQMNAINDKLASCAVHDVATAEVCNLAKIGHLVALAALWRRESRGGHYRIDHPEAMGKCRHAALQRRKTGGFKWNANF